MRSESVALLASAGCSLILALLSVTTGPAKGPRMDPQNPPTLSLLRPRGALARTLFDRIANDKVVDDFDKNKWYLIDLKLIEKESLRAQYVQLALDEATEEFLDQSTDKSEQILLQAWHSLVSTLLKWFLTRTSINGLLARGSMFVFSEGHFQRLLPRVPGGSLLDLGAGDGLITKVMASTFSQVFATEVSPTMRYTLAQRGYKVLEVADWSASGPFDVISCLNLLDRCNRPLSLLKEIRESLVPGRGRLIVALVLPYQPYVEADSQDHQPDEYLEISGETFEEQVNSTSVVLESAGYKVERWSRLPYLCEGDLGQSYYWLDDVVFVLKPSDD